MARFLPKLEFLCDVVAYVSAPLPIGPASWGTRLVFPVVRGAFEGPKFRGTLKPFGADWAILRPDNCLEVDVRIVLETHDAALVHAEYRGIIDLTYEQVEKLLSGQAVEGLKIHTAPRFETSHPNYLWLNRIQAVGCGSGEPEGEGLKVSYSWYVLRS
jgi:hypothetical protein